MKTLILAILTIIATAAKADDFGNARWIGAVTQRQANIPKGRNFTGAKLKEPQVMQAWAAVDSLSQRSIVLRKEFSLPTNRLVVRKATAYVAGLGFYEMTIDGTKIGDAVMAPHWSDYDKTVFYNTYDITSLFSRPSLGRLGGHPTLHTVDVLLGNGFYNEQGGRYVKMKVSFGPPTLLLRIVVEYTNGGVAEILSDDSWQWAPSPITFNSIFGGEDYDARLEQPQQWTKAVIQEAPQGVLRKQIAEPVRIMERHAVSKRLSPTLFDMGQNLAGFPEIKVRGKAGQQLKLTVGETITADMHVNQRQSGRPHFYTYTLKGDSSETWHPRFSYYGYQYIELEGAVIEGDDNPDDLPVVCDLQSCFIYNSAPTTGAFECSNELFNKTFTIIDRAVRSNWQSVWTDCPHREKLGWLEQDWLNGEGLMATYDCRSMIEQTMQQIADAQEGNGYLPEIAPNLCVFEGSWAPPFLESPEWGGAFIRLPYNYYQRYGSDKLIKQHYDGMKRYADYLHSRDSCCILNMGLGDWYDYHSGRAGFAQNTSVAFVATAHMYEWTRLVGEMAAIAGHDDDHEKYLLRADSIRTAINRHFFHPENATYDTGSQCALAIALDMDLMPATGKRQHSRQREQVTGRLIDDIHAHGDRLTTGDIGTRYLFRVLANSSRTDCNELLYTMLNHNDVPGYGYQISLGHTTLTEQWDPKQGASMNHFMMGHLLNLLIPRVAGVDVSAGDNITIAPMPLSDLTWAKGQTACNSGTARVEWRKENGVFTIEADIPDGATATIVMPYSGKRHSVKSGQHTYNERIKPNKKAGAAKSL